MILHRNVPRASSREARDQRTTGLRAKYENSLVLAGTLGIRATAPASRPTASPSITVSTAPAFQRAIRAGVRAGVHAAAAEVSA